MNVKKLFESRGPYVCPTCNEKFVRFDSFNEHIKKGSCSGASSAVSKPYCIVYTQNQDNTPKQKIQVSVSDYFYGYAFGSKKYKKKAIQKQFSCYNCGKKLRNNLRFMSHVRHKIENEWKENDNINDFNICNYCYRHYDSPFHLQCHIETVHATVPAATTCRICELNFGNEELFLSHMKDRHCRNELPYVCAVCSHRSSFYSDIIKHFRVSHENSSCMLCPFCLAIYHTANSYLTHVIEHMKKSVRCTKCRLQFFSSTDKAAHLESEHQSVLSVNGKPMIPRNLKDYTVFVKVSHHPLSPTKNKMMTAPTPLSARAEKPKVSKFSMDGWSLNTCFDGLVPLEYRAYARDAKVYIKLDSNVFQQKAVHCMECRESMGIFVADYIKHFQKEYKCRICPYFTRCYTAMRKHILRFHVTATSSTSATCGRENLSILPSKQQTSSLTHEVTTPLEKDDNFKNEKTPSSAPTLKLSSPELSSDTGSSHSKTAVVAPTTTMTPQTARRSIFSALNMTAPSATARKSITPRKRASPGNIDELFESAAKHFRTDTPSETTVMSMKSSKQRRKQLKPQKLCSEETDDEEHSGSVAVDAAPPPLEEEPPIPNSSTTDQPKDKMNSVSSVLQHVGLTPASESYPRKASVVTMSPSSMINPFLFSPNQYDNRRTSSTGESYPSVSKKLVVKINPGRRAKKTIPKSASTSQSSSRVQVPISSRNVDQNESQIHPAIYKSSPIKVVTKPSEAAKRRPPSASKASTAPKTKEKRSARNNRNTSSPGDHFTEWPNPPSNLVFSDVTKSSIVATWTPPSNCSVTNYKLVFQGSGLPTTQILPPAQNRVRLIGLRSNTCYMIKITSQYKHLQSATLEAIQKTLGLRENKSKYKNLKVDAVIVLDDDNDDDDVVIDVSTLQTVTSGNTKENMSASEEDTGMKVSKSVHELQSSADQAGVSTTEMNSEMHENSDSQSSAILTPSSKNPRDSEVVSDAMEEQSLVIDDDVVMAPSYTLEETLNHAAAVEKEESSLVTCSDSKTHDLDKDTGITDEMKSKSVSIVDEGEAVVALGNDANLTTSVVTPTKVQSSNENENNNLKVVKISGADELSRPTSYDKTSADQANENITCDISMGDDTNDDLASTDTMDYLAAASSATDDITLNSNPKEKGIASYNTSVVGSMDVSAENVEGVSAAGLGKKVDDLLSSRSDLPTLPGDDGTPALVSDEHEVTSVIDEVSALKTSSSTSDCADIIIKKDKDTEGTESEGGESVNDSEDQKLGTSVEGVTAFKTPCAASDKSEVLPNEIPKSGAMLENSDVSMKSVEQSEDSSLVGTTEAARGDDFKTASVSSEKQNEPKVDDVTPGDKRDNDVISDDVTREQNMLDISKYIVELPSTVAETTAQSEVARKTDKLSGEEVANKIESFQQNAPYSNAEAHQPDATGVQMPCGEESGIVSLLQVQDGVIGDEGVKDKGKGAAEVTLTLEDLDDMLYFLNQK